MRVSKHAPTLNTMVFYAVQLVSRKKKQVVITRVHGQMLCAMYRETVVLGVQLCSVAIAAKAGAAPKKDDLGDKRR